MTLPFTVQGDLAMRSFLPVIVIIALVALVAGCSRQPERRENSSNADIKVDVLFVDRDGFTVKRFSDAGNYVYYVTGPTDASTQFEQSQGKTRRDVEVRTTR